MEASCSAVTRGHSDERRIIGDFIVGGSIPGGQPNHQGYFQIHRGNQIGGKIPGSGHYHTKKTEIYHVLSGRFVMFLEHSETGQVYRYEGDLNFGDRSIEIVVPPLWIHRFEAVTDVLLLITGTGPQDPDDDIPAKMSL